MKQHNRFNFYVDYMPNKKLTCAPDCAFILQNASRNSYEHTTVPCNLSKI